MKKVKPLHYLFIFLNVLGIFLEYFVMYKYLLIGLLHMSQLVSLIISSLILMFLIFISIYSNKKRDDIFDEEPMDKISDFHLEATKKIRQKFTMKTSQNIKIKFVDGYIQPSVMFALIGNVYINTNKKYNYKTIDDVHFEGVLSHELGHVMHMPNVYFIANLRPTAILGNFLFVLTYNFSRILSKKKNKILNYIIFSLVYLIFISLNLINLFILYPFKRYEEFQADKSSLNFSNGYALRGYYYKLFSEHNSKLEQFRFNYIDFNHPNPLKHYLKLNDIIDSANNNCEFISHKKILVKEFTTQMDKVNKMINFYENHGDKSIISMYLYIGRLYEDIDSLSKAKEYYLLAGKNDIFTGYRRLIRILKAENNIENVLEYYKILSKNGDKEASLYLNYYEKEFALYKVIVDGEETDTMEKVSLKLSLRDSYVIDTNGIVQTGKFTRKRIILKFYLEEELYREYYFKDGEILSKKYPLYNSETDSIMQIEEFFH